MEHRPLYPLVMKTISHHLRFCSRPLSSSSSAAAAAAAASSTTRNRHWVTVSEDSESTDSPAYQHALKFQKPTTIRYIGQPLNSASFIGRIAYPLRKSNTTNGSLGVFTSLAVQSSTNSFNVLLQMWNEMAEMAMEHLKPNDFVYVWGQLRSFTKLCNNQLQTIHHRLIVKYINFVTPTAQDLASSLPKKFEESDEDRKDKYRMNLHLWQVFFSNPLEWRDLRNCKQNPRQPDFKHKDTGEALWLSHNDPPWIQRQLQLVDSRMGGLNFDRHGNSSSNFSRMDSDFGKYI